MFRAYQCPKSGRPLQRASGELIDKINELIRSQQAITVEGRAVSLPVEGGWYCESSHCLYPVRDGVLCLLSEQAVELTGGPLPNQPVPLGPTFDKETA
jgi:uncharacterized protein YbaR (Trm112 family)